MVDYGHLETETLLKDLERRIYGVYRQAAKETQEKLDDYMRRFRVKDQFKRKQLEAGEITEEYYKYWLKGQILIGKRWEEMRNTLAQDMTNANKIAIEMVSGDMPQAYALNHDYATFQVEKDALVDTSYTLFDRDTVERLIADNPDILPMPSVDIPKDLRWNRQKIQSHLTQAILQGEDITQIAKRMLTIAEMNQVSAFRAARTSITAAQNSGRIDGYKRCQKLGIKLKKQWIATLDGRTRHEHRQLDGQSVPIDKPFTVDGYEIDFPADPHAEAFLVYNCRCTLIADIDGVEQGAIDDLTMRNVDHMEDGSYQAWKDARKPNKRRAKFDNPAY